MSDNIFINKHFENQNYSEQLLVGLEYENCVFLNCDFSKANLNNSKFIECTFKASNLSLVSVHYTSI